VITAKIILQEDLALILTAQETKTIQTPDLLIQVIIAITVVVQDLRAAAIAMAGAEDRREVAIAVAVVEAEDHQVEAEEDNMLSVL
jgi:hypothetical protein